MKTILSINDLPPEILPEFWNDSARLNALYAPFRDRSVNPRDWDSKLNFWTSLINTWCKFNSVCAFSECELKKWFIHNGRTPACLNIVLNEMYKNQELQTFGQFMEFPQKTWSGWAVDLAVKKPLVWSFNKLKSTLVSPTNIDTKFVHIPSIKSLSEKLFLSVPEEQRNKLLTIEELVNNFKDVDLETVKLLLHYLQCQEKVDTIRNPDSENESQHKDILLIKLASVTSKVLPVCEVDIAKYKLEQNEKVLIMKLEDLETEKSQATKNAKQYLAKGMRQMAKTCLRKQHEIEKRIEKQVSVLENVQVLLGRVACAESDGKVLDSYKSGLAALKSVFKENGLTEDLVADTMDQIGDVLESHDDMQSTLSQSVSSTMDAELEEELAELLAQPSIPPPVQPPTSPYGGTSEEEDDLMRRLEQLKSPTAAVPTKTPSSSPLPNKYISST